MFISLLRTVILYAVIVATVRIMGKRQVGELEPAELVAAILISDLAAVPMQDIGIPLLSGVVPILTLLALELLCAELSLRSGKFRALLCGKPVLLIYDGRIDQAALRRNRLCLDELQECLRLAGVPDLRQVQFAVLETNGQLSTFLYPRYAPMTAGDGGLGQWEQDLPLTVISDGRVLRENLLLLGRSEAWLGEVLDRAGLSVREVYLLTADRRGPVALVQKEETV